MISRIKISPERQCVFLFIIALFCYMPFVNKAMHMDADMLVHTSRMILIDPVNPPLGEYGRHMALHDHTKMPSSSAFYRCGHPPLLPLLIAPIVAIGGAVEWPLHLFLFLFYLISIYAVWYMIGLFYNAKYRFSLTVLWAVSPALLVNAHNIMWDVAITGFMLLSLLLFLIALRRESAKLMFLSGLVAGIAALTKVNAFPLFLLCPAYLLFKGRSRFLPLWLGPAAFLPLVWAVHNLLVFGKVQFVSIGWYSFAPGDIRYRMERNLSYFGGALLLPVFWVWLMIARKRFKELMVNFLVCGVWGILLVAVLKKPLMVGALYTLYAAAGLWLLYKMALFFHGAKKGAYTSAEPFLIAGYAVLYLLVLNIMPSASMRYILPLVPLGLLVLAEELTRISAPQRTALVTAMIAVTAILSISLAIGDYCQCEADRRLPSALIKKGYEPEKTWYYGRLSYDWYLYHAGFRNLRADGGKPKDGEYLIDEVIPGDYKAAEVLGDGFALVAIDTLQYFDWPVRTMGFFAGFYGNDRLPYGFRAGSPQKMFRVYRIFILRKAKTTILSNSQP